MLAVALWIVGWLLLIAVGGLVLFLLGRSTYRRATLLFRELSVASERLTVVNERLQQLNRGAEAATVVAVFDSPSRLRQQRYRGRGGPSGPTRRTMTRRPTA